MANRTVKHWTLLILVGLQGCATVKLYPVCQYIGPAGERDRAAFTGSVRSVVKEVSGQETAVTILPNLRYASVRIPQWRHEELERLWPSIGCVGTYSNSLDRAKYAACQKYIRESLRQASPGVAEHEVLCFESKNCPGRNRENVDAVIYCNGTPSP